MNKGSGGFPIWSLVKIKVQPKPRYIPETSQDRDRVKKAFLEISSLEIQDEAQDVAEIGSRKLSW